MTRVSWAGVTRLCTRTVLLLSALSWACAVEPLPTLPPAPVPAAAPALAGPCVEVERYASVAARTREALASDALERYPKLGHALERSFRCAVAESPLRGRELGPEAATLLTAMGEALLGETPAANASLDNPGIALLYGAHKTYAHLAARELGPEFNLLQLQALERLLPALDDAPPRTQACKTNQQGVCVYRRDKKKPGSKPILDEKSAPAPELLDLENARLRAYTLYLHDPSADSSARTLDLRYRHIELLFQLGRHDGLPELLDAYMRDAGDTQRAHYAAIMLLDVLTIRWSRSSDEEMLTHGQALLDWLDGSLTQPWWTAEDVARIRELEPRLRAGVMWRRAQYYAERGKHSGDLDDFRRCRDGYMEIRARFDEHEAGDELFFRAALCAEAMRDLDDAIALYRQLLDSYPDSEDAKTSLHYLGEGLLQRGDVHEALEVFVEYADTYSKDEFSPHLLERAAEIADILGEYATIVDIAQRREAMFVRKNPVQAARIHWDARPADNAALEAYTAEHLQRYSGEWLPANLEARLVLAEAAWTRSCPGHLDTGLCSSAQPEHSACGLVEQPLRLRSRRRKHIESALTALRMITKFPERGSFSAPELARIKQAKTSAAFYLLELELEQALAASAPHTSEHESMLHGFEAAYAEFAASAGPEWAARAYARQGWLWELRISPLLAASPLVPPTAGEDCPRRRDAATIPIARAITAYEACLSFAVGSGSFDATAARCELALTRLDPRGHAAPREFMPTGSSLAPLVKLQRIGVQAPL